MSKGRYSFSDIDQFSSRLQNFSIGPSNNQAVHVLLKLLRAWPPTAPSLIYICGGTGLGKTHLANAFLLSLSERHPSAKVCRLTAERFCNAVTNTVRNTELQLFRDDFDEMDILVLEDIQFVRGFSLAQRKLRDSITGMIGRNKIVIIDGDQPPEALTGIGTELQAILNTANCVRISPPSLSESKEIALNQFRSCGIETSPDLVDFLLIDTQGNPRKIAGRINRFIAWCTFHNEPLTLQSMKSAFAQMQ